MPQTRYVRSSAKRRRILLAGHCGSLSSQTKAREKDVDADAKALSQRWAEGAETSSNIPAVCILYINPTPFLVPRFSTPPHRS